MGWRGSKVSQICAPGKDRQQVADKAKALPPAISAVFRGACWGGGAAAGPSHHLPVQVWKLLWLPPGLLPARTSARGGEVVGSWPWGPGPPQAPDAEMPAPLGV